MDKELSTHASSDPFLTTEELADYLKVSPSTVYDWRTNRTGPKAYRIGKHTRYRASDVEAWLEKQVA